MDIAMKNVFFFWYMYACMYLYNIYTEFHNNPLYPVVSWEQQWNTANWRWWIKYLLIWRKMEKSVYVHTIWFLVYTIGSTVDTPGPTIRINRKNIIENEKKEWGTDNYILKDRYLDGGFICNLQVHGRYIYFDLTSFFSSSLLKGGLGL